MAKIAPRSQTNASASRARGGAAVSDGDLWAVPLPRLGFCPLIIARAPAANADVDFAFAYLKPQLTQVPPSPESVGGIDSWESAWIGLVSSPPLIKRRWKHCGTIPDFDREQWPIPPGRASAVNERDPIEEWGKEPWGEMWSIETTLDEPTMTVIDNVPATRDEALRYPDIGVVTAASSFEKALVTHFKNRSPSFWDMQLSFHRGAAGMRSTWREHARRARACWDPATVDWLRAGRKTDRSLRPGMWMGFPIRGGGFGAAMLIAKPPLHERFFSDAVVMAMRRRWDHWPTLSELVALQPDDGALVTPTSMICVRDGRWRVLGEHPAFDPERWVYPIPWSPAHGGQIDGVIRVSNAAAETVEIRVDPALLNRDPLAGRVASCMSPAGTIEQDVPCIINGTHWALKQPGNQASALLTPQRLAAWRDINAAIRKALAAR